MRQSETDMTELIFAATERLMARDGLDNLSMHKIAKEAKISPGTIYLYFKNKDELFEQFARRIFTMFSHVIAIKIYLILSNIASCGGIFGVIWKQTRC